MSKVTFQRESLTDVLDECSDLIYDHWEDIALDQENIKLDPDWDAYSMAEDSGRLVIVTARDQNELVGYSVYFVTMNMHYRLLMTADSDIFWLAKDRRKGMTGIKLIKASEKILKELGVMRILSKVKIHKDVGKVFERLGYTPIERVYSKSIL